MNKFQHFSQPQFIRVFRGIRFQDNVLQLLIHGHQDMGKLIPHDKFIAKHVCPQCLKGKGKPPGYPFAVFPEQNTGKIAACEHRGDIFYREN